VGLFGGGYVQTIPLRGPLPRTRQTQGQRRSLLEEGRMKGGVRTKGRRDTHKGPGDISLPECRTEPPTEYRVV